MKVGDFVECTDFYCLTIESSELGDTEKIVRLLLQGKIDGATIDGHFDDGKVTRLEILVPKAQNRRYDSIIGIGAKKIFSQPQR
jgi:hypothetical protein